MSEKFTDFNPFDYLDNQAEVKAYLQEAWDSEDPLSFQTALGLLERTAVNNSSIPEDTRVSAPHPKNDGERQEGVIREDLSIMYLIAFDDHSAEFVYKAEDVRNLEEIEMSERTALDYLNNWRNANAKVTELEELAALLQAQLEQTIKDSCDTSTKLFIANRRVAKLQAEVADKETLIRSAQLGWDIESDKVAELQAELKRHKFAIRTLYKCFRQKEPTPSAWVDEAFALKEMDDE